MFIIPGLLLAVMSLSFTRFGKDVEKITPERDKSFLEAIKSEYLRSPFLFLPHMTKGGENISQSVRNEALAEAMERGATKALVKKLAKISQLNKATCIKSDGWAIFGKNPLERAKNLNRNDYVRIIGEVGQKNKTCSK